MPFLKPVTPVEKFTIKLEGKTFLTFYDKTAEAHCTRCGDKLEIETFREPTSFSTAVRSVCKKCNLYFSAKVPDEVIRCLNV